MYKKIRLTLLLLAIVTIFQSCGIGYVVRGVAKKSITVENEVVPKDFIDRDATLLILLWPQGSYNKFVQKAFDKFYTGKKEYITLGQFLTEEKYQDIEDYPFVFSQGPGEVKMYSGESYSFSYGGSRPFHIFDRENNKCLKSKVVSGFFYRVMQAYAIKLDRFIK